MTRTAIYKSVYFGYMLGAAAIALAVLAYFHFAPLAVALVLVGMLIPGRVLGFFWRDLLRGLRLLNAGEFVESKRHSERFLADLQKRPWLKHLVWLGSSTYSRDPEVLALNNLGAAEMQLGELDSAKAHLMRAIMIDKQCALPFFNLGALYEAQGEAGEADRCFKQAAALGFTRGLSDAIVTTAQTRFANTDGAGRSRAGPEH